MPAPLYSLLLQASLALLLLALGTDAQSSNAGCADRTMKGQCGACGICCCYKGPLRYLPDDDSCSCKVSYGSSFVTMICMAVLVCVGSLVGGAFFGGGYRLSPYKREDEYRTSS